ncbi:hypothetical protein HYPSUDRAFT_783103 [Hypholoma sublateritium FD-334 SS-4]|uniref:Uncharacterized protein n=1 Tax=Hypholoma sublateritium (strain FD-334 SS-4) TaxID=945553 RepID=A0A0D2MB76_HYPSF|nr:hypothetical protein HYPSUDRAFT_783103 [Hypholoma sublateritium FD-334 SS-4]
MWTCGRSVGRRWCGASSGSCALGAGGGLPFRMRGAQRACKRKEDDNGTIIAGVVNVLVPADNDDNTVDTDCKRKVWLRIEVLLWLSIERTSRTSSCASSITPVAPHAQGPMRRRPPCTSTLGPRRTCYQTSATPAKKIMI